MKYCETALEKTETETARKTVHRGSDTFEYILYLGCEDGRDSYSIQVIRYRDGEKLCQATVSDVTNRRDEAIRIFDLLSDGIVEPYLLKDVVYDLMP